jgi:hypothetical protein
MKFANFARRGLRLQLSRFRATSAASFLFRPFCCGLWFSVELQVDFVEGLKRATLPNSSDGAGLSWSDSDLRNCFVNSEADQFCRISKFGWSLILEHPTLRLGSCCQIRRQHYFYDRLIFCSLN